MRHHFTPSPPCWKELAATLKLRSNLKCSLTPPEQFGSKLSPSFYETPADFKKRIAERRKWHAQEAKDLHAVHGLKTVEEVKAKIEELEARAAELWVICEKDKKDRNII